MHRQRHELAASAHRPWLKEEFPPQSNAWRVTLTPTPRSGCSPALHTILLPPTGMSMLATNGDVAAVLATNAIGTSFALSKMVSWVRDTWAKTSGTKAPMSTPGTHCGWVLQGPLCSWSFSPLQSSISCAGACAVRGLFLSHLYSRVDLRLARFLQPLSTRPVPADLVLPGILPGMSHLALSH